MAAEIITFYNNKDSQDTTHVYIATSSAPTAEYCVSYSDKDNWTIPAGKVFKEWNSARDGSGTSRNPGDTTIPPPTAYYAIWEDEPVEYITTSTELTSIADAIRTKGGTSSPLSYPDGFISAINDISGGGGGGDAFADAIIMRTISEYSNSTCSFIGSYAFYACSELTTASFPACTSVGNYAFYGCNSLTSISFPVCTSIGSSAFGYCTRLTIANFPSCTNIGASAFSVCYSLTTISFPVCTSIRANAFYNCSSLTTISFPVCTSIGSSAFYNCRVLATISFPACTSIGVYAFGYCASLTTASFSVCSIIFSSAFRNCSKLTSVYFMSTSVVKMSAGTASAARPFYSTPMEVSTYTGAFGSIYVPASLVDAYKSASGWSFYSSRITGI